MLTSKISVYRIPVETVPVVANVIVMSMNAASIGIEVLTKVLSARCVLTPAFDAKTMVVVFPVPVVVTPSDLYQVKPIAAVMLPDIGLGTFSVISGTNTNWRLYDPGTETYRVSVALLPVVVPLATDQRSILPLALAVDATMAQVIAPALLTSVKVQ